MEEWTSLSKMKQKNKDEESSKEDLELPDNLEFLSGKHHWQSCSHARPTFCNVCHDALSGVTSHGLSCEICKFKAHKKCAAKTINNCKWTTLSSVGKDIIQDNDGNLFMPHQWMEGNLPVSAKCVVCDKTCGSVIRLQDWRCMWCRCMVHTACRPAFCPVCPLGLCKISVVPPIALHSIARQGMVFDSLANVKGTDDMWDAIRPVGCSPLLVFVNSKSGDNQGVKFLRRFKQLLNPAQVFDLMSGHPFIGLKLFRTFDPFRILVCGGDGSVGWVLAEVDKLQMQKQCQVGVLPLGTGNDLARVLGWGSSCDDDAQLPQVLEKYEKATTKMLERWSILVYESHITYSRKPSQSYESMTAYEDNVHAHIDQILHSEEEAVILESTKSEFFSIRFVNFNSSLLYEVVKDFISKVNQICRAALAPYEEDPISEKCKKLKTKLDLFIEALQKEGQHYRDQIRRASIREEELELEEKPDMSFEDTLSIASMEVDIDNGENVQIEKRQKKRLNSFAQRDLITRINSLRKVFREIIDQTEKFPQLSLNKQDVASGETKFVSQDSSGREKRDRRSSVAELPESKKRMSLLSSFFPFFMRRASSQSGSSAGSQQHSPSNHSALSCKHSYIEDVFPKKQFLDVSSSEKLSVTANSSRANSISCCSGGEKVTISSLPPPPDHRRESFEVMENMGLSLPVPMEFADSENVDENNSEEISHAVNACDEEVRSVVVTVPDNREIISSEIFSLDQPISSENVPLASPEQSDGSGSEIEEYKKNSLKHVHYDKKNHLIPEIKITDDSHVERYISCNIPSSLSTTALSSKLSQLAVTSIEHFDLKKTWQGKERKSCLPLINPMVNLPSWPNVQSSPSRGLIGKVLLANADALCAPATPLIDVDVDEWSLIGFEEKCVMNNYFGIGIDAKITLDFHMKREEHPEKCRSRTKNFMWYGVLGSKELLQKTYRNLEQRLHLECDGQPIPLPSLQGIVILNIQSFMGGTNFWGSHKEDECFVAPSFDDRILEVVAVFGTVQMAASRIINLQHHRIAQCGSVKLIISGEEGLPCQVDGEAWMQSPGVIRIVHKNRMQMLCRNRQLEYTLKSWEEKQQQKGLVGQSFTDDELEALKLVFMSVLDLIRVMKLASLESDAFAQLFNFECSKLEAFVDKINPKNRLSDLTGTATHSVVVDLISRMRALSNEVARFLADISQSSNEVFPSGLEELLSSAVRSVDSSIEKWRDCAAGVGSSVAAAATEHEPADRKRRSLMRLRTFLPGAGAKEHKCRSGAYVTDRPVRKWGVEDVASWISSLHLDEYRHLFEQHDIQGSELLQLDRRDLKDLGMSKIGHIKRLQFAIDELKARSRNETD